MFRAYAKSHGAYEDGYTIGEPLPSSEPDRSDRSQQRQQRAELYTHSRGGGGKAKTGAEPGVTRRIDGFKVSEKPPIVVRHVTSSNCELQMGQASHRPFITITLSHLPLFCSFIFCRFWTVPALCSPVYHRLRPRFVWPSLARSRTRWPDSTRWPATC